MRGTEAVEAEADADLAALDLRSSGLVRWTADDMASAVATRIAGAFPSECAREVEVVVAMLPPSAHPPTPHDVAAIAVRGEAVNIPARIYFPEPSPRELDILTEREKLVALCLFTRHADGFVRERMVKPLLLQSAFWTVPFVVQLLGEYVIEIVRLIEEQLRSVDAEAYAAFLNENPVFWRRTRSRMVSYWDCYHRREFPTLEHYPGRRVLDRFEWWRTQNRESAGQSAPCGRPMREP